METDTGSSAQPTPTDKPTEHAQIQTVLEGKKGNIKIIMIVMVIIAVILLIINIGLMMKLKQAPQQPGTEQWNLTYSAMLENGTSIGNGTSTFSPGTVAKTLGFETNKLDQELGNISKGETKTIGLDAEDAFGKYDSKNIYNYERETRENRINEINRTQWITLDIFTQAFEEQPELNKNYTLEGGPWPYKVIDKNETHVRISQEPTQGQKVPFGTFEYEVIKLTTDKITLKLQGNDTIVPTDNGNIEIKFTENEIITTLTPEIGQEVQLGDLPVGIVTSMNSTHIFIDANSPFADEKITVTITRN
jgi:FKBP-type peptidyl-prolyl cis-trans isomerase 2